MNKRSRDISKRHKYNLNFNSWKNYPVCFNQGLKSRRISRNFVGEFVAGESAAGDKLYGRFVIFCRWKFGETTNRFHEKRPLDFVVVWV